MTRQRKWQLKKKAEGYCVICGRTAVSKNHCRECRDKQNIISRNHYRRKHGIPLGLGLWERKPVKEIHCE